MDRGFPKSRVFLWRRILTSWHSAVRALIAGPRCIYPGSVYDAISARIAEDLGFEAGMFAGSIASFTVLGAPDVLMARGSLALTVPLQRSLQQNTRAGRRVVAFGRASGGLPATTER